jgi:hypothetical protein
MNWENETPRENYQIWPQLTNSGFARQSTAARADRRSFARISETVISHRDLEIRNSLKAR